ncbi:superoxide dismutase family protein [Dongia rigui]|uniref:Superoxide dismutase family protein n=1 Tax=Dongia rigui TaxID=940149 RepID=A0ABU5E362_9PROT|nr:superoxide dismutase family protein [Dongia rigui]MDY0873958.1 superoxide dismutase family protein [Dongia rigui]
MTPFLRLPLLTGLLSAIVGVLAPLALADEPQHLTSDLKSTDGAVLGTVTVTSAPKGVLLRVEAKGLPAGWHGMHFHEKGDCGDAKFANAGGHVHRGDKVVHGLLNNHANDAGDLPNVFVASDGSLNVELYSTLSAVKGGHHQAKLADQDGFAIVVHAAPDDYTSQPIGGAGARIACAAFK